eukprot:12430890-Karenia_brevis.AAC.1
MAAGVCNHKGKPARHPAHLHVKNVYKKGVAHTPFYHASCEYFQIYTQNGRWCVQTQRKARPAIRLVAPRLLHVDNHTKRVSRIFFLYYASCEYLRNLYAKWPPVCANTKESPPSYPACRTPPIGT